MPLPLQCFLHFHPTASTMACFSLFWPSRPQCPKFPSTQGAGHCKPYTPTTLLSSLLTRTNVFSYKLQNPHFWQCLDCDIEVFVSKVMSNFFLHANREQQTKESMLVDGTSSCVILECLVMSIACITWPVSLLTKCRQRYVLSPACCHRISR